jgi:hypothetical protein
MCGFQVSFSVSFAVYLGCVNHSFISELKCRSPIINCEFETAKSLSLSCPVALAVFFILLGENV